MKGLKQLFDLQDFERNPILDSIIEDTKNRYPQAFVSETKSSNVISFNSRSKKACIPLDDFELADVAGGISLTQNKDNESQI